MHRPKAEKHTGHAALLNADISFSKLILGRDQKHGDLIDEASGSSRGSDHAIFHTLNSDNVRATSKLSKLNKHSTININDSNIDFIFSPNYQLKQANIKITN